MFSSHVHTAPGDSTSVHWAPLAHVRIWVLTALMPFEVGSHVAVWSPGVVMTGRWWSVMSMLAVPTA